MTKTIGFVLTLLIATHVTYGADSSRWWERDPVFLADSAVVVSAVLGPPPVVGSKLDEMDHQEILRQQRVRSKRECDRAQAEVGISLDSFFGPRFGPLREDEVKKWGPLFFNIATDTEYFVRKVKGKWQRQRPYLEFSDIHPCTSLEKSAAYPSGHATIARTFADVLSRIYPERKQQFMERAEEIGRDRVLAGVHHPSDVEASKRLGDAVFKALMKTDKFRNVFNANVLSREITPKGAAESGR